MMLASIWKDINEKADRAHKIWIEQLRAQGFKAAHPNDGWVDRENSEVCFIYPHFNDNAGLFDKVMLGWDFNKKSQRSVRLVGKRTTSFGVTWWKFKDIHE